MSNNLVYLAWIIIDLSLLLAAFTLWGRHGILAMITANVVMMNVFVLKGIVLFGMDATGGNVLYASIFLGTDMLEEYFGARDARRAVFIGLFVSLLFLIATRFILLFHPAPWDTMDGTLHILFTPVWRVVGASMLAYLISQNMDVLTYGWLKRAAPRHLWLRNNGSTWSSQIIDTLVFCTAAFAGRYPTTVLLGIILSTYLLKIIVAALDTPFIYLSRYIIRRRPALADPTN